MSPRAPMPPHLRRVALWIIGCVIVVQIAVLVMDWRRHTVSTATFRYVPGAKCTTLDKSGMACVGDEWPVFDINDGAVCDQDGNCRWIRTGQTFKDPYRPKQ